MTVWGKGSTANVRNIYRRNLVPWQYIMFTCRWNVVSIFIQFNITRHNCILKVVHKILITPRVICI